jgi:Domain of unknown function (DUF4868)
VAVTGEIDIDTAAATLVVAWRTGRNAHGRMLKAGGSVISALRSHAKESLAKVSSDQGHRYNPDDEQEEAPFLTADQDELLDTALLAQLKIGSSLPLITPNDVRQRPLALYALIIGNDSDSRMIFIRKGNPVSLASKSIITVLDQTLTRVTQPILAFDSTFDVILHGSTVWILNQKHFEALFKESDAVLARTSEWADRLSEVLPIADDSKEWLTQRLRQNSIMRRKIQSILRSQYLSSLTPDVLRKHMAIHGLDPADLMRDDNLVFNKDTEHDMLLFLNEDLWAGDFSGDQYAAARKARR